MRYSNVYICISVRLIRVIFFFFNLILFPLIYFQRTDSSYWSDDSWMVCSVGREETITKIQQLARKYLFAIHSILPSSIQSLVMSHMSEFENFNRFALRNKCALCLHSLLQAREGDWENSKLCVNPSHRQGFYTKTFEFSQTPSSNLHQAMLTWQAFYISFIKYTTKIVLAVFT